MGMLERHIQIRHDTAIVHQFQQIIDMRIGINIVQAYPCIIFSRQLAKLPCQIRNMRFDRASLPEPCPEPDIQTIRTSILRDDQQLFHTRGKEHFSLIEYLADRIRYQRPAQVGNDAKRTVMRTPLGNFQIGIMPRRQLDTLWRHKIDERFMRTRQITMHGIHDFFYRIRPCHGKYIRQQLFDKPVSLRVSFCAKTTCHDNLAVFAQRFGNRFQRLFLCRGDETAGIDDDQSGISIGFRRLISFRTQPCQNPFRIDQRFRASQRHESDRFLFIHFHSLKYRAIVYCQRWRHSTLFICRPICRSRYRSPFYLSLRLAGKNKNAIRRKAYKNRHHKLA